MSPMKGVLMIMDKKAVEEAVLADVVDVVEIRGRNVTGAERLGTYNERARLPEVVPTGV